MARAKAQRPAIEFVKDPKAQEELGQRLSREIQDGLDARTRIIGDGQAIDRWHAIYEGGDSKLTKNWPWVGAANLTSYLGTEKVDAWRARVMQTVFTEPVWIVEGFGESEAKAPYVETFHQWKLEEERLQSYLGRAFHNGFVEGTGVLEVAERPEPRKVQRQTAFAPLMLPTGETVMDPQTGQPMLDRDEQGLPKEVPLSTPGALPQTVEEVVNVCAGPVYRVVSLKDFVALPGHATDVRDLWGYAKRVWVRMETLKQREKAGFYTNVDKVSAAGQPSPRAEHARMGQDVTQAEPHREEVEIWEFTFLDDLEGDGADAWYVATLSVLDQVILRLKRVTVGQPTYLLFTPLPRSNSIYGYSLIGHKLGTIIDEHTAIRNQMTDRSTMANAAPIKRVMGSLWDPQETPWGPLAVIDVRDPNEIEQFRVNDVPGSVVQREGMVLQAGERVSGLNDVATGVGSQQDRTLGEVNLVTQQSFVRMEEAVKYLQEPLEQLFNLRHEIWKRAVAAGTVKLPPSVIGYLSGRGVMVPSELVQPEMLEGVFRGKPRASVEGADPMRLRNDFVGFVNALGNLARMVPGLAQQLNQPQAIEALLRQGMRVFGWKETRLLTGLTDQQLMPPIALPGAQEPPSPNVPQGPQAPA